jgi:hypothetical protein
LKICLKDFTRRAENINRVHLPSKVTTMIKLQQTIQQLACGGAAILTLLAGTNAAQAVSFVSTFRLPGTTVDVGTVDASGNYNFFSRASLQLTDIAVNNAGQIFGTTYDQLYRINPGTDTQSIVGNLTMGGAPIVGMNGLAFDNNNNLYGIAGRSTTSGVGDPGFYSINTSTGATTLISNLGSLAPTAFGFSGSVSTGDTSNIAFNSTTNKFFAVSGNNSSLLFTIDPLTATTATIGTINLSSIPVGFVSGLTFDQGIA